MQEGFRLRAQELQTYGQNTVNEQLTLLMATSVPLALCVPWYTCENCPEPSRSPSCRNRSWGG